MPKAKARIKFIARASSSHRKHRRYQRLSAHQMPSVWNLLVWWCPCFDHSMVWGCLFNLRFLCRRQRHKRFHRLLWGCPCYSIFDFKFKQCIEDFIRRQIIAYRWWCSCFEFDLPLAWNLLVYDNAFGMNLICLRLPEIFLFMTMPSVWIWFAFGCLCISISKKISYYASMIWFDLLWNRR